jgi:ADP-heptose:LPS heptosyltransferase
MKPYQTAIIRCGAIGDLISMSAAVRQYRLSNQDEHISLFCGESCKEVYEHSDLFDDIYYINDDTIYNGSLAGKFTEMLSLSRRLISFDKCYVVHKDMRWMLPPSLAGIREIHSLADISTESRYESYNHLLNGDIGIDLTPHFTPNKMSDLTLPDKYICVAPSGARNIHRDNPQRRWTGFRELISNLSKDYHVVLLGKAEDSPHLTAENIIDLCGKTTLSDTYHIIDNADEFIGNDSGLLHLALCTNTKKTGIFTATAPAIVLPPHHNVEIFKSTVHCSPCERNGTFRNDCDLSCIDSIKFRN